MPIDPQIAALFAGAPERPSAREQSVAALRRNAREAMLRMPAPDLPIARIADRTIAGPGGPLALRLYTPPGDGPFPIILFLHGGGFMLGDLDTQDSLARGFAAGARAVVVSVDYRLAPEHRFPAAPDDGYAALAWAAEHAPAIDGDARRIAVAGDSAGGILAAAVALMARDRGGPALAAQVAFYASCDYPEHDTPSAREFGSSPMLRRDDSIYFWESYLPSPAERGNPYAAPARAADHAGLPPAFIGTPECDPSRDEAEAYAAKLAAAGVTVEAKRYAGMVHGFLSLGHLPAARAAMADACAFLRRQFALAPA